MRGWVGRDIRFGAFGEGGDFDVPPVGVGVGVETEDDFVVAGEGEPRVHFFYI